MYTQNNIYIQFRAVGQLRNWEELPHILKQDRRKIWSIKGKGYKLVESVIKCLQKDYDIIYSPKEVLEKLSSELITNLEYTTFMKSPISNKSVEYNMMEHSTKSKAACDLYLPALANSLDIHIRIIQKIGSFFAVLHTHPTQTTGQKKTVNLVYDGEKYSPVVYIKGDKTVGIVSPQPSTSSETVTPPTSQGIQIVGYTPPDVIVISDTKNEEETQENSGQEESTQVIPSSNPKADGINTEEPQSPEAKVIKIVPLDDTNDLPVISPPQVDYRKKIPFDMKPFFGMLPEVVNRIPWNVDGLKYYVVEVSDNEYFCDKYKDGQYFVMNTSQRKGFWGIPQTGKCRGNFTCTNNKCAFYLEEKKHNKTYFTTIGEQKFCFTCNTLAVTTPCTAAKMIEYSMERRLLSIYHIGEHTCQVKINTTENDDYMKRSLTELGGRVTPKKLAQIQMMKELEKQMDSGTTDMSAIVDIATKLTNKQ